MATKKKSSEPGPSFAAVADCHIGNSQRFAGPVGEDGINSRGRINLNTLQAACAAARKAGVSTLFVAGDMFHSRRPEPAILAAVQKIFDVARADGLDVVIVPGNHDMLDASAEGGNTAVAPLWECAEIITRPLWRGQGNVLAVPYDGRVPMAQHLTEVMAKEAETWVNTNTHGAPAARYLVTHVGVWDDEQAKTSRWLKNAKDGMNSNLLFDSMAEAGIKAAFVGNYHEHMVWRRGDMTIYQIGTLCPGGFGDAGIENRGLMMLSDGTKIEVPGPRFALEAGGALTVLDEKIGNTYFVRQVGGGERKAGESSKLGGYEYVGSPKAAKKSTAAATPQSPEEALAGYVAAMELPAGVTRDEVAEMVKDCWKKGA